MVESWQGLKKWERLYWARIQWGDRFEHGGLRVGTAAHAAKELGIPAGTYRTYEREPGKSDGRDWGADFAKAAGELFGVSWTWLIQGDGSPTMNEAMGYKPLIEAIENVPEDIRQDAVEMALSVIAKMAGLRR